MEVDGVLTGDQVGDGGAGALGGGGSGGSHRWNGWILGSKMRLTVKSGLDRGPV